MGPASVLKAAGRPVPGPVPGLVPGPVPGPVPDPSRNRSWEFTIIDSNHFQLHPTPVLSAGGWDGGRGSADFRLVKYYDSPSSIDLWQLTLQAGSIEANAGFLKTALRGVFLCSF